MAATADPRAFGSEDVYQRIDSIENKMPKARHLPIRDKALAHIRFLNEQRAWVDQAWDGLPVDAKKRLSRIAYDLVDMYKPRRLSLVARLGRLWWRLQYLREWSHDPTVLDVTMALLRTADLFADTILTHVERDHPEYPGDLAAAIAMGRDDSKLTSTITTDNVDEYLARLLDD